MVLVGWENRGAMGIFTKGTKHPSLLVRGRTCVNEFVPASGNYGELMIE